MTDRSVVKADVWLFDSVVPGGNRVFLRHAGRFWMVDVSKRHTSFSGDAGHLRSHGELTGNGVREVQPEVVYGDRDPALVHPVAGWSSTCHPGCGTITVADSGDGTALAGESARIYIGTEVLSIAERRG